MDVKRIVLGSFGTNTYFLDIDNNLIIIDPAGKYEKVNEIIANRNLLAVLLTHGHFDHIKAVDDLYKNYMIPVYLNKNDEELVRSNKLGLTFNMLDTPTISCPIKYLDEGELNIGPL